ncbi:hypothetical protein BDQ17DRAFT_1281013 [Cyathus striatus]|nr:hypothetical protein BDQ17DRAFT_1281013 [Cyathus striatus]
MSSQWDVLGPFPIHAREQHFLSPAFPLNLSETINLTKTWPSSYADGGRVGWHVAHSDGEELKISFPHIRWKTLRETEGWAVLQHHAVLRTILTIHPPELHNGTYKMHPQLRVNIKQGSYFAVIPHDNISFTPEWHAGNIYDMERALPRTVDLPTPPSTTSPTEYQFFVSGDYEIRLFGDPHVQESEVPVQVIGVQVQLQEKQDTVVHESTQDVIPDFLAGYAFGEALGIGLRSISGWWTVSEVYLESPHTEGLKLQLKRKVRLAPSQLRVVPLSIVQDCPMKSTEIKISIELISEMRSMTVPVSFVVSHKSWNLATGPNILKASFFYATYMPSVFLAIPPTIIDNNKTYPVMVALHGAGVDIISHEFWSRSLPRAQNNWIAIPSGRTSWGLDWHGPSALDVWSSIAALADILSKSKTWNGAVISPESPLIVMGHSNGGQGAWYLASRFPDRVLGVVAASAYIKSQAYVPLIMSRSAHFVDPGLRSILESSLTPDDNDIHLSNLANIPILAIHGGNDENVPTWHSREALSLIEQWSIRSSSASTLHKFREDHGQGHWYPTVLDNEEVVNFLNILNSLALHENTQPNKFTVTTSEPHASGSLNGWRIEHLSIPGRIGRLTVDHNPEKILIVRSVNIDRFSVDFDYYKSGDKFNTIRIDNSVISFQNSYAVFERYAVRSWRISASTTPQSPSRMQAILSSPAPLILIIPDYETGAELSVATRIAHDLHLYHRLDVEIVDQIRGMELLSERKWTGGNVVFIGPHSSHFVSHILRSKMTPIELSDGQIYINGIPTGEDEQAIMFLHPNPLEKQSVILFCLYEDLENLERAARLFPIRTGVAVPSWIMIHRSADVVGAAGVHGAGVWGPSWNWNEQMSWYY